MILRRDEPSVSSRSAAPGTVLDLFAGCGGLSLGFRTAGFDVIGGVELDPVAAATHGANFHPDSPAHAQPRSVAQDPIETLREFGWKRLDRVDVLVGGPPCQAFARIGRAKLRAESARKSGPADHRAWLQDPRVGLYANYLEFVDALRPSALLMENVPDVLNHGGVNHAEAVCEELERHGYEVAYTLLNAVHFGVPQMRERMFLIGLRKDLRTGPVTFPTPTHSHSLPPGYALTRACALASDTAHHYAEAVKCDDGTPATTAEQALADLPSLPARELLQSGVLRRGARALDMGIPYARSPHSAYAWLMRNWPGLRGDEVTAHVIRWLPRDYPIFARMKPGDQYPQAFKLAESMLDREVKKLSPGHRLDRRVLQELRALIVPPYDATKFPNKWRKMEPDAPARTLMAHLGKDSYSHIHYDSQQARTISVREAARLQSFPDGFQLCGSMNAGFRQVGNAVPPLLAYALARHLRSMLGLKQQPDFRKQAGLVNSATRRHAAAR
jgi:DNA (cytosine-5)-methyltransferase 1